MAFIFVLSSQPGLAATEDPSVERPLRIVAHLVAYTVLGALLAMALGAWTRPSPGRAAAAAIVAVLYGVSDEIHQSFVPERTGQAQDVVVDAIGALLGVLAFVLVARARNAGRTPPAPDGRGGPPTP